MRKASTLSAYLAVRRMIMILALVLVGAACGGDDATSEATTTTSAASTTTTAPANPTTTTTTTVPEGVALIALDGNECTSSIPEIWSGGALEIENKNTITMAVVMGTYNEGFGHADLVAYGRDISTRPDFIDALEIYEVGPQTTRVVSFEHGSGQYFTTCLDSTSTMIVLDDVTVRN